MTFESKVSLKNVYVEEQIYEIINYVKECQLIKFNLMKKSRCDKCG